MIHRAVLDACDVVDGLTDRLISEPDRCRFDFKSLACDGGDSPACLTAAQVEAARIVTDPLAGSTNGPNDLSRVRARHGARVGHENRWLHAKSAGN
jgi:hypothetical protein